MELEDITNRHKMAKLDCKSSYYSPPLQERLPSPSSPSSSLSPEKHHRHALDTHDARHLRQKLVLFELSRNQQYENSPLLTPKDEDYCSEPEDTYQHTKEEPLDAAPQHQQLDRNPDYVALGSTVSLLSDTRRKIVADIDELAQLRESAQTGSKEALMDFYVRLIYQHSPLPAPHKIVEAPTVQWGKYHEGMTNVSLRDDCTNNNEKVLFKKLNVFGSSS